MYLITVKAQTIRELKKKISNLNKVYSAFEELGIEENAEEINGDELEVVESPFSKSAPQLTDEVAVVENVTPQIASSSSIVDSNGIPWDKRIHSSSKELTQGGTWRYRRGVDKILVAQVEAEYKGGSIANVQHVMVNEAGKVVPNQELINASQPVVQAAPVVAPAPAPVPSFSGHTLDTFKTNFAMVIANLIAQGKIDQNYVNTLKDHFKAEEIWTINDEQKSQLFDAFVSYGFVQKVG